MSRFARALLVLAIVSSGGPSLARPWSLIDPQVLLRLAEGATSVALAELQAERARLAAEAAGAVVSGTVRTSAEASWRSAPATPAQTSGWDAGLGAVSVSTQWYLVPAGPTHDAAQRAARGYLLALDALAEARRDAAFDALERIVALERLAAQAALAEARSELAERARDVTVRQAAAGAAGAGALADADLGVAQASGEAAHARADLEAALRAFERTFGASVEEVWRPDPDPLAALARAAGAITPAGAVAVTADELQSAIAASARVADALRSLDDAVAALARARRDAGVTVSLGARLSSTGDAGRWSVGAGWDTRSMQPSLDLSIDPWNPGTAQTTASLSANLSLPFGAGTSAGVAQAEVDEAMALERLDQAWSTAALELENLSRAADQAYVALELAVDRYAARLAALESVRLRAEFGAVAPLDLQRAELDALDSALSLVRAEEQERIARLRLELALGRLPSFDPIAAALTAAPTEVP